MSSSANIWPSVISALSGLAGVGLGGWLTYRREALKEANQRTQTTGYLAILVVAHLDQFIDQCVSVSYDDGTSEGRPAGRDGEYHAVTVLPPSFDPLALSVDWKVLPTDILYEVLNLPHFQGQLNQRLAHILEYDDPPDYSEFFRSRQLEYARLALMVVTLSQRLRKYASLPPYKAEVGGWDRDSELRQRVTLLEDLEAERHSSAPPMPANP